MWKKWDPNSGFAVVKKAPSPWKKLKKKKKNLPAYLFGYDLKNVEREFFLNKWVSRYLSFDNFKVLKNGSS